MNSKIDETTPKALLSQATLDETTQELLRTKASLLPETNIEYLYKHRPRNDSTAWRYQEGKYNAKPKDPEYQKTYYALKLKEPVACLLCGSMCVRTQLIRHQQSRKCRSFVAFLNVKYQQHDLLT
jgi:hypothetical protein